MVFGGLLTMPGVADAAKPRVVIAPKAGQRLTRAPVRFVVHAGPEINDLQASLNGTSIGRDFLVGRRSRRVLTVSNSYGLRPGRNVLKVVAYTNHGTRIRRATVRFTVADRLAWAGAGVDLRVARGSAVELHGHDEEPRSLAGGRQVRWKIVDVPRGSRLLRHSASQPGNAPMQGLHAPDSLTPTFRPDVDGTYTLQMTAGIGPDATRDLVTLYAVPANPLVEVHTRVTGGASDPDKRPAIQVGNTTYLAPFLSGGRQAGSYWSPVNGLLPSYQALFQVLVLNRTTLQLVANRTYGICRHDTNTETTIVTCRMGDDGTPKPVSMRDELASESDSSLIIVNSLPAAQHDPHIDQDFLHGVIAELALGQLDVIGFPDGHAPLAELDTNPDDIDPPVGALGAAGIKKQLETAPVDSLSVIGVPGLEPGEADYGVIPEAAYEPARGMNGWLLPDQNRPANYHFVSPTRVEFDTRATSHGCNNSACTITATLGDQTLTGTAPPDGFEQGAGFLLAVYDPHTLERKSVGFFATNVEEPQTETPQIEAMTNTLRAANAAGDLVLMSSVRGDTSDLSSANNLLDDHVTRDVWHQLATEVAAAGGTLNNFNRAAVTPDSDYTLLGFGGAGQGHGQEAIGKNARLRGVLTRDRASLYRPANVTEVGEPAERLIAEVLRPSGQTPWPYADDPGVTAAISYIGDRVTGLGPDPRASYWTEHIDAVQALKDRQDLAAVHPPAARLHPGDQHLGGEFTLAQFNTAKEELYTELGYVAQVRIYLGELASPTNPPGKDGAQGANAWPKIETLKDKLTESLNHAKAESASRTVQVFDVVASLFDIASLAGGSLGEAVEKYLYSISAGMEFGASVMELNEDGSEPDAPSVGADEAAQELNDRLQHTSDAYNAIGDVIVSDWSKLELIGKYGGCNAMQGQCPKGLEDFAYPDSTNARNMVNLALERSVDELVLPFYYPVIDMGESYSCPENSHFAPVPCVPDNGPDPYTDYNCGGTPFDPTAPPPKGPDTPFASSRERAPETAWARSLDTLDPTTGGPHNAGTTNLFRTWLSVAVVGDDRYAWAPESLLTRMFTPVNHASDVSKSTGLGISAVDWMRQAATPIDPHATNPYCGSWRVR